MTQTLIEKLEALPRYDNALERIDDGEYVEYKRVRAIIEQYKTEGTEPDAWTWERATEISELPGKEKYGGFERVHSRNKPNIPEGDKSRRNLRPLYFHPSPAIIAELVKALEEVVQGIGRNSEDYMDWPGVRSAYALIARAKAMTE